MDGGPSRGCEAAHWPLRQGTLTGARRRTLASQTGDPCEGPRPHAGLTDGGPSRGCECPGGPPALAPPGSRGSSPRLSLVTASPAHRLCSGHIPPVGRLTSRRPRSVAAPRVPFLQSPHSCPSAPPRRPTTPVQHGAPARGQSRPGTGVQRVRPAGTGHKRRGQAGGRGRHRCLSCCSSPSDREPRRTASGPSLPGNSVTPGNGVARTHALPGLSSMGGRGRAGLSQPA